MVLRLLNKRKFECTCADILQNTAKDPNFLENIITCDESWFLKGRHLATDTKSKKRNREDVSEHNFMPIWKLL
jgi:hypothetical protein